MAKKLGTDTYVEGVKKITSIGNSKHSTYKKARHKKQGKKRYRGQGK